MRRLNCGPARCLLFPFHGDEWGGTAPDTVVALEQPIHGGVEVLGGGVGEVETVREGGRVLPAGGGALGMRPQDAGGDHGADEVARGGEACNSSARSNRKAPPRSASPHPRTCPAADCGSTGVLPCSAMARRPTVVRTAAPDLPGSRGDTIQRDFLEWRGPQPGRRNADSPSARRDVKRTNAD